MKSNSTKIPLFLSALIFFCLLAAFLYLNREINSNNEESQVLETEWQTEALRRDEIKALDRSIKVIETERAQLESHFAQSSDIVPFLDKIESLAPEAGVKAEVSSVDISEDGTGLVAGMKATGTFTGLYKFLNLLENSPYELEFVSMDIQKEGQEAASNWDMIFRIKLLSFIP